MNILLSRSVEKEVATPEVEIIAHSYTSGGFGLREPTRIDHFIIKSGIGSFYNRLNFSLNRRFGAHSQKIVWGITIGSAFASAFLLKGHGAIYTYYSIMAFQFLNFLASLSVEGAGRIAGEKENHEGFIYPLLKKSFTQSCPETLAELRVRLHRNRWPRDGGRRWLKHWLRDPS